MKKRILYIGRYSTPEIRNQMDLYNLKPLNFLRKMCCKSPTTYTNSAVWHGDYIKQLSNYSDRYEIHVVSPAQGLKREFHDMLIEGITYHFYSVGSFYFSSLKEKRYQASNHKKFRERFVKIYNDVKPDAVILCGAENPDYSYGVMDIKGAPVVLILQTLLNSPKRIAMNIGGEYRRKKETEVFKHAQYFCTTGSKDAEIIHKIHPNAQIIPVKFITHTPPKYDCEKKYDFVFFASFMSRNKGLDDAINALGIVANTYPKVTLNLIGGFASSDYKNEIMRLITRLKLDNNVSIAGRYPNVEDVYKAVQEARFVLSPGITAFNSTVRESMLMGMPSVVYQIPGIDKINSVQQCLLAAELENVEDLADKMLFAMQNPDKMKELAKNGKVYADANFGADEIGKSLIALIDNILECKNE